MESYNEYNDNDYEYYGGVLMDIIKKMLYIILTIIVI